MAHCAALILQKKSWQKINDVARCANKQLSVLATIGGKVKVYPGV